MGTEPIPFALPLYYNLNSVSMLFVEKQQGHIAPWTYSHIQISNKKGTSSSDPYSQWILPQMAPPHEFITHQVDVTN